MKDFVYNLAQRFAPVYRASEEESSYLVELALQPTPHIVRAYPPWNPIIYFSACQLTPCNDCVAYEINYLSIWDYDTGGMLGRWSSHPWDTERTAILVTGPKEKDLDAFSAKEAYYAAHEGTIVDRSGFYPAPKDSGVTVFWSHGKHASYPGDPRQFFKFEQFKSPGFESHPKEYTLVNIGTLDNALAPWILYKPKWGKADSVYKKLKIRLWKRKTWQKIVKPPCTKEQIKRFQEFEALPATGEADKKTIKAAQHVDTRLIQYIQRFSQKSYMYIRQSAMKGKDIELLAKTGFSEYEIEKIVKNNMSGKKLREYVKKRAL